jgi:hypothetical protein
MSIELTACRFADTRQRLKIGHLIQDMHKAMRQYSTTRRAVWELYDDRLMTEWHVWEDEFSEWVLRTATGEAFRAAIEAVELLRFDLGSQFDDILLGSVYISTVTHQDPQLNDWYCMRFPHGAGVIMCSLV